MKLVRAGLVFATAAATLAAPTRAEDIRLAPSSEDKWILNYAEQKCRLARYFGEEDDRYLMMLDQFQPGTHVTLTVAGDEMWRYAERDNVQLELSPLFSNLSVYADSVSFGDFRTAIFLGLTIAPKHDGEPEHSRYDVSGLPHINASALEGDAALKFSRRSGSITFELPGLAAALNALNDCTRDLVYSWGLDLDSQDRMRRKAEPINFQEIAERISNSYPSRAFHEGEQATLALRIIVDADGSIEECQVNEITSTRYLRSPACDEFGDRAMFAPAEDANGKPIKSYYAATIGYRIN
ncbi:MAG: hypothetical protein B7Y88_11270 [Sphingomonadales bacterium 32-64-17]|nr:MAG: hypothetical protein B7Y88_11270 [Sphingomonadales bacterium 32-64-17]